MKINKQIKIQGIFKKITIHYAAASLAQNIHLTEVFNKNGEQH